MLGLTLRFAPALVNMVGAKVFLSEMVGGDGMDLGGEHRHLGIVQHYPLSRARRAEKVDENDVFLKYIIRLKYYNIKPVPVLGQSSPLSIMVFRKSLVCVLTTSGSFR